MFHASISPKTCTNFLSSIQYVSVGKCKFTRVLLYDQTTSQFKNDSKFGTLYNLKIDDLKHTGMDDFEYCFKVSFFNDLFILLVPVFSLFLDQSEDRVGEMDTTKYLGTLLLQDCN